MLKKLKNYRLCLIITLPDKNSVGKKRGEFCSFQMESFCEKHGSCARAGNADQQVLTFPAANSERENPKETDR